MTTRFTAATAFAATAFAATAFAAILITAPALAQSVDTDSVSGDFVRDCIGFGDTGTVTLNYSASLEASVTPYIESADDDATFSAIVRVDNSLSRNCRFGRVAPLNSDPHVNFGDGGSIGQTYGSAVPSISTVILDRDGFANGNYRVSGNTGASGFDLALGVAAGPLGIAVTSNADKPPITLLPTDRVTKLEIGNVVWNGLSIPVANGSFRDRSSFELSAVRIRLDTGSEAETGNVRVRIPVYKMRVGAAVTVRIGEQVGVLEAVARYVRGDYLRTPTVDFSASRRVVRIGDTVRVEVTINNRSSLTLSGGTVRLNTAALVPQLFPLDGNTTQTYGSLVRNRSRTVTFELTALTEGFAPIEAEIEGGWNTPVPAARVYRETVSVPGGVQVSNTAPLPPIFEDGFEVR